MVMTPGQIVFEYKTAKSPLKQIGILADQNLCSRKDIVKILEESGLELPKVYQKPAEPKEKPAPKKAAAEPVKHTTGPDIKGAALDAIKTMLYMVDSGEIEVKSFFDRVLGVLLLEGVIDKMEA